MRGPLLAALLALVACSSRGSFVEAPLLTEDAARALADAGAAPREIPTEVELEPPKPSHPPPFRASEMWSGSLLCASGVALLKMRVVSVQADEVRALVDFTRMANGVTGRFAAVGHFDASTRRMLFEGVDWVAQPSGESMVDLDGMMSTDGRTFMGRAVGPGCVSFSLRH